MKKSTVVTVVCSVFLVFALLPQVQADVLEKSFNVKQGGTFYLDTDSGAVDVESHDRDVVEIAVKRKGSSEENFIVEFSKQGNDVLVKGDKKGADWFSFGGSSAHFIVRVPLNYNVDLKTSGGSIYVSSLTGKLDAYTSGGSIKLGEINGDVDIKTSGGSIKVGNVMGQINAHTSGGSVHVKMTKQPTQDSRLTTSGGGIVAYLPASIAINLYASTSGGSVSSEFDVNGSVKRTKISGEINGGGPELYLKTSGGSVRVKEL